jgi:hypothetical protein
MSYGPRLVDRGERAMEIAAETLRTANEFRLPDGTRLIPGSIWSGDRLLIYASDQQVIYTIKDGLFEWTGLTESFVRDELVNAIGEGARRAEGMIILAKIEIAFLTGIFVPWYVSLGVHAAATGLFYNKHKSLIRETFEKAENVKRNYDEFQSLYPKTTEILKNKLRTFILVNLASGVTAPIVAFFIGRMIRAWALSKSALGMLLRILLSIIGITIIHSPPVALRGAQSGLSAAEQAVSEAMQDQIINERDITFLQHRFAEIGINISSKEAEQIIKELLSRRDTPRKLFEFAKSIEELLPVAEKLLSVYPYFK